MFLDLSGFSKMTDTLMQHGQHGAEVLAGLMYSVFDPLVKSIFGYGGKIVSFAGDGIMALYPVDGDEDERATALRALTSAWVIQQELFHDNPERDYALRHVFPVSVKIGITVGSTDWRILRSEDGRQATYYFRGSAVEGSAQAEHQCPGGRDHVDGGHERPACRGHRVHSLRIPSTVLSASGARCRRLIPYVILPKSTWRSRAFSCLKR
jgi:class 3 adenylate cyclase